MTKVAERYGASDVMSHKVCKEMNIPVPPRWYWIKKSAGLPVEQEPLLEHTDRTIVHGVKTDNDKEAVPPPDVTLGFLGEEEHIRVVKKAIHMQVDPRKRKLHPVLIRHKAEYAAWAKSHPRDPYSPWKQDTYRRAPVDEPAFYESVSAGTLPRLYRILDAYIMLLRSWAEK